MGDVYNIIILIHRVKLCSGIIQKVESQQCEWYSRSFWTQVSSPWVHHNLPSPTSFHIMNLGHTTFQNITKINIIVQDVWWSGGIVCYVLWTKTIYLFPSTLNDVLDNKKTLLKAHISENLFIFHVVLLACHWYNLDHYGHILCQETSLKNNFSCFLSLFYSQLYFSKVKKRKQQFTMTFKL